LVNGGQLSGHPDEVLNVGYGATSADALNDAGMTGIGISWRYQNHTGKTDSGSATNTLMK
jgi:hypothetical protein